PGLHACQKRSSQLSAVYQPVDRSRQRYSGPYCQGLRCSTRGDQASDQDFSRARFPRILYPATTPEWEQTQRPEVGTSSRSDLAGTSIDGGQPADRSVDRHVAKGDRGRTTAGSKKKESTQERASGSLEEV